MPIKQGDLALLNDPVAQELLHSTIPARLAYVGRDGTPRVLPIWFHWNGAEIVLGTALQALKVQALMHHPKVALTIDSDTRPYKVLQIRGTAQVETVQGMVPEYAAATQRYLGAEPERVAHHLEQTRTQFPHMARIVIRPEWVGVIDFATRFPGVVAAARSRA
jgi:PPOX class probable F420-dependent enzyme